MQATDANESVVHPPLDDIPPPKPDMHAPPPYEESDTRDGSTTSVTSPLVQESSEIQPPSYEEVQRLKALEAAEDFTVPLCHVSHIGCMIEVNSFSA